MLFKVRVQEKMIFLLLVEMKDKADKKGWRNVRHSVDEGQND
ncbi:hypothetical protein ACFYKX_20920 [Cytobacillus sp. FJAT-54145]|uniref:Uncharacterized protein n=1 Tax=Cytobacillus spartinae TaxID=3299023 RepID=A0ABW6KFW0_9BACI